MFVNRRPQNVQKLIILEGFSLNGLQSAYFFTYYSTGQKLFSTFCRIWHVFDIRSIKNYIILTFWRLGTMLERFFEAKSFGLHISNPKHVPGNIDFDGSKMAMYHAYVSWLCIMAMYHGYVSWLCIMAMFHAYVSRLCIMAIYHGYVYYRYYICIMYYKKKR